MQRRGTVLWNRLAEDGDVAFRHAHLRQQQDGRLGHGRCLLIERDVDVHQQLHVVDQRRLALRRAGTRVHAARQFLSERAGIREALGGPRRQGPQQHRGQRGWHAGIEDMRLRRRQLPRAADAEG
ncbi:hypothetical protein QEG98_36290 [Myxococcus sp. MxC21-1]|uniref:hypothetical protein n=1 Tax=Myxococcus sp. MxC21-1 TaxID=3041439 RepID=UPI00292D3C58|nr:hypothetical protein [Myxococcus sp. MxC21-1]WNZ66164.1 hypothetical protein QEG98_36290 [Myxococcus sp. MxC21-1]